MTRYRGWFLPAAMAALVLAAAASALQPRSGGGQADRDKALEAIRLNNLGVAYMNLRRSEAALEAFDRAWALDGTLLAARLNRGIALLALQRLDQAEEALLEVSRRQPDNPRAWFNLGLLYRIQDETEQALAAFERVAKLDPEDAETHYFLGVLYQRVKKFDSALASFGKALALNPYHVSAQFGLASTYQRMGDSEQANRQMERFQRLMQEKLGTPIGSSYGDQGKYSIAEQILVPAGLAGAPIPVRFVAVPAEDSGLRIARSGKTEAEAPPAGGCFFDYDNDGRADLLVPAGEGEPAVALFRNTGGRFDDATAGAKLALAGRALGCVAGDYDNDGRTDVVIALDSGLRLFRNQGDGTLRDATDDARLAAPTNRPLAVNFLDYDHDGDLDLLVSAAGGGPVLWRNNGNSTFTDVSAGVLPVEAAGARMSVATDFDNDRAVDMVLARAQGAPILLRNPREGVFPVLSPFGGAPQAAARGVVVFDFDKDGWMDAALAHDGPPGLSLWRNVEGKRLQVAALPTIGGADAWGLVAVDYDNDGWIDLAAIVSSGSGAKVVLLRNEGSGGFRDRSGETGLEAVKLGGPGALMAADCDGDGDADLVATRTGGAPVLLRNEGGNRNNWLRLTLKALADNKSAFGTKVEIHAGVVYQKFEVQASSGYLGQNAPEILAGLGQAKEADVVRMLWPTGVLQDEVNLAAGRSHQLAENDRRGSSCPILFSWNGARYEFVSDLIGPGIVGHWVGPGERNTPDPTEYVKVEGNRLRESRGRLSLRLLEPMEEVVYLDQVRLLAVDHPAEVAVYPNERFAGAPPFPDFRVIVSRGARLPVGVRDNRGRDLSRELSARDRRYVTGFRLLPFAGFAELHAIELDLGAWDPKRPLRLLMHGYTDYFTATSIYAAHQSGIRPIPPYLEARDGSGRWRRVIDDLGFPAGLARTMVVDLTGRLPAGTRQVRIATNLRVYWDQILLDETPGEDGAGVSEVPLAAALLDFRGYPREVRGDPASDIAYVYEEVSRTGPYAQHAGYYTRYGDVLDLLAAADDRFAILGSGDEVRLEFDPTGLAPLRPGWERDYFFYADGFSKDMDFYAAYGYTVEPLPFHAMRGYPYRGSESYPRAEPYLRYRLEMNTRQVSGRGTSSLRFDYRHEPGTAPRQR